MDGSVVSDIKDCWRKLKLTLEEFSRHLALILQLSAGVHSYYSAHNSILAAPVTEDEVKTTLFQLRPSKAPGIHGYSALFFQKFWDLVRSDFL